MAENFQSEPFFGTECALQPSTPVLRNATSLAGSVCNFSRLSTPAVSSAWLLPSDSSTCCQQLMDSAYPYLPPGTTMVTALSDQGQSSASALSYPGVFQRDLTGKTDNKEAAFRNTTFSSLSMTAQGDNILDPNALVLSYPTMSASLVQATPSQVPNQGYTLALSYQESRQVYYYDPNSLGPLMAGELRQCLQACGSVSHSGCQASALQSEMVMMLKEIQPMNVQTTFSNSAIYYSTHDQDIPDTSLQVEKMETSLEFTTSRQTLHLLQSPDLCNACMQDGQMKTLSVDGDWSLIAPIDHPSEFLPLLPAPSLEKTENNNLDLMTADISTLLDDYVGIRENQHPSLLPLGHTNSQQALNYTDSGRLRKKISSDNASLGSSSLGQDERVVLQCVMGSRMDFAHKTTLGGDIHLPQLFYSLTEQNQFQDPTVAQSKKSRRDQVQESSRTKSVPVDQVKKNGQEASEMLDRPAQPRTQLQNLVEGEEAVFSAGSSEGTIDNIPNHLLGKPQEDTPSTPSTARAQGQDKTKKARDKNSNKTKELKQSRNRVKAEEKTTMPRNKKKRNPPELSHNNFKKPRTHLGMHMLESVQVFHPLGKKNEKKSGISSSRVLLNFSSNKDPKTRPATTSLLDVPCDGQGTDKTLSNAQRTETNAHKECPSPSQYDLHPPGKVKLVPLPFLALENPHARPVSRKHPSLSSCRPTAFYPVRPHSHSAKSTTLKPSKPAPASTSLMASDKSGLPIAASATRPNISNPVQPCTGPQTAVCRPVSYRESSHTSLQRELASTDKNTAPSPPKPQIQYLLQDFSRQPIPWKKVDIPGPVISQPITDEQRPEREAMKRRAQQERENAAKYTSLGKLQFFLQREKDMEISQYYGYAM